MKTNKQTATAFVNGYFANSGNLHTDGQTLTSYWTPIARHANGAILLTVRNYSATTIRHKFHVRHEAYLESVQVFEVPNINASTQEAHRENALYLEKVADGYRTKAAKARKWETFDFWTGQAIEAEETARNYRRTYLFNL